MSSPFQTKGKHRLLNIEEGVSQLRNSGDASEYEGLTVLVRKFAEGDYRRWQKGLAQISKQNAVKTTYDEDGDVQEVQEAELGASWEGNRDLLFTIGIVEWNFRIPTDEGEGEIAPVESKYISLLDADVSTCIRNEIFRINPCLWDNLTDRDARRLGIEAAVKND